MTWLPDWAHNQRKRYTLQFSSKILKYLHAFALPQCWFGYYRCLSAPKCTWLNIGEKEGHIWVRRKVWRVNVRNFRKNKFKRNSFCFNDLWWVLWLCPTQGLKKTCISGCPYPLGRQLANLFCLPRAVAPISKFKINIEDDLHGPLPIGQLQCTSWQGNLFVSDGWTGPDRALPPPYTVPTCST